MSLSESILNIWKQSHYEHPTVQLLFYDDNWKIVISDSDNFIRFMSLNGQIYLTLKRNCEIVIADTGDKVYSCLGICSPFTTAEDSKDLFVLNKIIPFLL